MTDIRKDDRIQFARLLDEIWGIGLSREQWVDLRESTGMTTAEIESVLLRAQQVYEKEKAEL